MTQTVEERIGELTTASNLLTSAVENKVGEIDEKVSSAENKFNSFKQDIKNVIPLPLNLFSNSLMRAVEVEGHPTGFSYTGCAIKAVHPYTKGFEGPYSEFAPNPVAPSSDDATEELPYWYSRYHMGERMVRGGLSGGWGGILDGNILKITSTASNASKFFRFPVSSFGAFYKIGLRFWVKIIKGSLGFGMDDGLFKDGYNRQYNKITKEQTDAATDGWLLVDKVITLSWVTTMQGNVLNFGLQHDVDSEIYIALPYCYVVMNDKQMLVATGETGGSPVFTPGE